MLRPPTAAVDNRRRHTAEAGDFRLKLCLHRTRNRKFEATSLQQGVVVRRTIGSAVWESARARAFPRRRPPGMFRFVVGLGGRAAGSTRRCCLAHGRVAECRTPFRLRNLPYTDGIPALRWRLHWRRARSRSCGRPSRSRDLPPGERLLRAASQGARAARPDPPRRKRAMISVEFVQGGASPTGYASASLGSN